MIISEPLGYPSKPFLRKSASSAGWSAVEAIVTDRPVIGWPAGPNALFFTTAQQLEGNPFLWLEPDAVPMSPGWLDAIEAEYQSAGKPFLGHVYASAGNGLPPQTLSGVAVYPATAHQLLGFLAGAPRSWDVEMAHIAVPQAHASNLIQHFWGQPGLPPIFAEAKTEGSPANTLTPANLRPQAVLFHRNKDGSLISLLRRKLNRPEKPRNENFEFLVVLHFSPYDHGLMARNAQWMAELDASKKYDCVLSFEANLRRDQIRSVEVHAQRAFHSVSHCVYPRPKYPGWPAAPNWAFQQTARHMEITRRSWFWIEADAIPTKPEWLDVLQEAYVREGMPFMGPLVGGMGHMNGVGVYPADFPARSPQSMQTIKLAWDYVMARDMLADCYDASHLIQHCWGIINDQPMPRDGPAAHFHSQREVDKWLLPTAVMFHRCKDGSLINRLRERRR